MCPSRRKEGELENALYFCVLPIQEVKTIWILLKCLLLIHRMQINPCFCRKADSYEMKGGILGRQIAPWQVWCPRQSLAVYVDNGETHPCCYGDNIDFWWWKALSRCGLACVFTGLGSYGLNLSYLRYTVVHPELYFSIYFLLFQFNFSILPAARLSFSMRKHACEWRSGCECCRLYIWVKSFL